MHASRMSIALVALLALLTTGASAQAIAKKALKLDIVRLVEGEQIEARPDLFVEHDGIVYHFADESSLAAFRAEPTRYEVADGGACGSMGPLSGLGSPERFAVHEGRVYFFASDACKARFTSNPERCIETDNPLPSTDEPSTKRAIAAMDKAIQWAGGRDAIAGLDAVRLVDSRTETHSDQQWQVTKELAISFPDRYMKADQWNEKRYTTISTPKGGAMGRPEGIERIAESRRHAFERSMAREVLVLLHAYASADHEGESPSLHIAGAGETEIDGQPVEGVALAMNGATSTLWIDGDSGQPIALDFVGRDGTASVGLIRRTYTRMATAAGITLPVAYTLSIDGKPLDAAKDYTTFEPNPDLPEGTFAIIQ